MLLGKLYKGDFDMEVKNKEVLQQAAARFAENIEKYPIEEQLAIISISKNIINGCSWEFVRNNPDLRKKADTFAKSKTCSLKDVTYSHDKKISGYLVEMNFERLTEILSKEGMGVFDQPTIQKAIQHRQDAIVSCAKLMQKGYKGRIGIYCTNDSKTITVDGKSYPAFAITLKELCQICDQRNYGFPVRGVVRSPMEILQREDGVIKACIVAPSSNALFIDIAPAR